MADLPADLRQPVIEIPLRALFAAADLLRDLLDVEIEHERCPLCDRAEGHADDCLLARAAVVLAAFSTDDASAQLEALQKLDEPWMRARVEHAVSLTLLAQRAPERIEAADVALEKGGAP